MAKKPSEVQKIVAELNKELEHYTSRIAPKFQRRTRGKLRKLQRTLNRIRPLKIKAHSAWKAERDLKVQWSHLRNRISQTRQKISSHRSRIISLDKEIRMMKGEIPLLEKNIRNWSRNERLVARKHRGITKIVGRLNKAIGKMEARKEKVVRGLQKYFQ